MSEIRKSKQSKWPFWLFGGATVFITLSIFTLGWLTKERKESLIIAGGPFDTYFAQGLYPDHRLEIELWLEATIPKGTTRTEANRILAPSFSGGITGGNEVTIASTRNSAGGSHTEVTLIFDAEGKFKDAKVTQHWAYL